VAGELERRQPALQRRVEAAILEVRGKPVILDSDLAAFYGVETERLVEQMKRNRARFPEDFAFQLTREEFSLIPQNAGSSGHGGRRKLPWAFTEQGALQAAGVLRSGKADEVSVAIARAFVAMRAKLLALDDFVRSLPEIQIRLEVLEGDAAQLEESDADLHAKVAHLTEGLKSMRDVIRTLQRTDKQLPPHS